MQPESVVQNKRSDKKTMQAAVITAPQKVELQTTPIPEPDDNEIRVRLEGCGLCASDLPVWEGRDWFDYPVHAGNPGHEGWGVVDAVGKNVKTICAGYRVTGLFQNAYAGYDIAKETEVVELPHSLEDKPFPGEPLGCALNIFRRSQIKHSSTVAIIGIGWLGSLLVQLAKNAGAKVIAVSRRNSSQEKAKTFGADYTFSLDDEAAVIDEVENITNGKLCECVIEATGKQQPLDLAAKLTAVRGRLVIAGYHQDGLRQVNMQLWNWRGIDVINAHERDAGKYIRGIREAVKLVNNDTLNPFPLFTHVFDAYHIGEAFKMQQAKPEGFTKALITFE